MDIGQPTIDQLRIFLAVVDEGSFNRAAKKLGRALSAISYGVATLEAQLGVTVFRREGSRRPELTDAGRALLPDARAIADDVDGLMARARGIRQGLETELSLAVDVMFPSSAVAAVLHQFQEVFPTVNLRLHVEALGAVAALVFTANVGDVQVNGCDFIRTDDDGRIVNIKRQPPRSDESHCASQPVRFALEMEQAWFARRGLQEGTRLALPPSVGSRR